MITAYVPRKSHKDIPQNATDKNVGCKKAVKRTKIICGFPGVGKTHLDDRRRILDMESSCFSRFFNPETCEMTRNTSFPSNYAEAIFEEYEKDSWDYVLVSSHESVRNELKNWGVPYIIVAPKRELKNEYMIRYLRRGSPDELIENMYNSWDDFIDSVEKDGSPVIWLEKGIHLADVLLVRK